MSKPYGKSDGKPDRSALQQQRQGTRRGGPSLMLMLVYGVACAVGGAYFDRHLLPEARLWFSDQVSALSGFGSEQEIQGLLERAGTSQAEREAALADVRRVYRAQRNQELDADGLEALAEAELILERSRRAGTLPSADELAEVLEVYRSLASDL